MLPDRVSNPGPLRKASVHTWLLNMVDMTDPVDVNWQQLRNFSVNQHLFMHY